MKCFSLKSLVIPSLVAVASSVFAETGTINFSGEIINQTCRVENGMAGSQDSQTVILDKVPLSKLVTAGHSYGNKIFNIRLVGCLGKEQDGSTGNSVFANFILDHNVENGVLKNVAEESRKAQNVGIQLLNKNGDIITFGTPSNNTYITGEDIPTTGGDVVLTYSARYIATAAATTTGEVKSKVNYSIVYN